MNTAPTDLTVTNIRIDEIDLTGSIQPRVSSYEMVVNEYAEKMAEGVDFPPIVVFHNGQPEYWLADGFHRTKAAMQAGKAEINAQVYQGGKEDAAWYAYGANKKHGMQMSNADKERNTKLALTHENAVGMSDNDLAKHIGVSQPTVGKYRAELEASYKVYKIEKRKVKRGSQTYTVNTRNIGGKLSAEVIAEIKDTAIAHKPKEIIALENLSTEMQRDVLEKITSGEVTTIQQAKKRVAMDDVAEQLSVSSCVPTIYKMTALDFLATIDDASVDLLITDPPYMTDIEGDIDDFANSWAVEACRKVKPTGRAYICIGAYPHEVVAYINALEDSLLPLRQALIWYYRNTLGPTPKLDFKKTHQFILYLHGDEAPDLDCPVMTDQFDVLDISAPDGRQGDRLHKWQKPDALAERLIRISTKAGDSIIDPFAGTGTFLVAAGKLGRLASGCDISDEMIQIAKQRGVSHE